MCPICKCISNLVILNTLKNNEKYHHFFWHVSGSLDITELEGCKKNKKLGLMVEEKFYRRKYLKNMNS